jgi:hypothetical protein
MTTAGIIAVYAALFAFVAIQWLNRGDRAGVGRCGA